MRLSLLEIFLLETAAWLALWLISDYVATLLTLIVGAIVSAVLVVALMAEWVERSKVPRWYFQVMALSIGANATAAGLYVSIFDGELGFLKD